MDAKIYWPVWSSKRKCSERWVWSSERIWYVGFLASASASVILLPINSSINPLLYSNYAHNLFQTVWKWIKIVGKKTNHAPEIIEMNVLRNLAALPALPECTFAVRKRKRYYVDCRTADQCTSADMTNDMTNDSLSRFTFKIDRRWIKFGPFLFS